MATITELKTGNSAVWSNLSDAKAVLWEIAEEYGKDSQQYADAVELVKQWQIEWDAIVEAPGALDAPPASIQTKLTTLQSALNSRRNT